MSQFFQFVCSFKALFVYISFAVSIKLEITEKGLILDSNQTFLARLHHQYSKLHTMWHHETEFYLSNG